MRAAVHPDDAVLFVSADGFVDGNQLMSDRISLLPDPHCKRPAVDVLDDVNLALVLRKRQTARSERESPLPRIVIDGQAQKFHKSRAGPAFRFVLCIGPRRCPKAGQIQLGVCGKTRSQSMAPIKKEGERTRMDQLVSGRDRFSDMRTRDFDDLQLAAEFA